MPETGRRGVPHPHVLCGPLSKPHFLPRDVGFSVSTSLGNQAQILPLQIPSVAVDVLHGAGCQIVPGLHDPYHAGGEIHAPGERHHSLATAPILDCRLAGGGCELQRACLGIVGEDLAEQISRGQGMAPLRCGAAVILCFWDAGFWGGVGVHFVRVGECWVGR